MFMLKVSQQGNDGMDKQAYIRVQEQESNTEQEGSPDWPELASSTLGITQLWEPGPLRGGGAPTKQGVPRASHKAGDVSGNSLLRSVWQWFYVDKSMEILLKYSIWAHRMYRFVGNKQ